MKAYLEIVEFADVITTSGEGEKVCCDFGCGTDLADANGNV